jgi:hypothetical protein
MMNGTSPASLVDRIRRHLVGLKMPRALEVLDHILRRLECGEIGAPEALEALLGEELTLREGRRVRTALKMGRLLTIKTSVLCISRHQERVVRYPRHEEHNPIFSGGYGLWPNRMSLPL